MGHYFWLIAGVLPATLVVIVEPADIIKSINNSADLDFDCGVGKHPFYYDYI